MSSRSSQKAIFSVPRPMVYLPAATPSNFSRSVSSMHRSGEYTSIASVQEQRRAARGLGVEFEQGAGRVDGAFRQRLCSSHAFLDLNDRLTDTDVLRASRRARLMRLEASRHGVWRKALKVGVADTGGWVQQEIRCRVQRPKKTVRTKAKHRRQRRTRRSRIARTLRVGRFRRRDFFFFLFRLTPRAHTSSPRLVSLGLPDTRAKSVLSGTTVRR